MIADYGSCRGSVLRKLLALSTAWLGSVVSAGVLDDAIRAGDTARVKQLLAADPAAAQRKDGADWTPLHTAVLEDKKEIAELLIASGAQVDAKTVAGLTPLQLAVRKDKKEIVALLISKGASVTSEDPDAINVLLWACMRGYREIAKSLMARGVTPDNVISGGMSPLCWAARNGDAEIVRLLLEKGANANAPGSTITPLQIAAAQGNIEIALLLLKDGANVNAADGFRGMPALFYAAEQGQKEMWDLLLKHGADIRARDSSGGSAVHHASLSRNTEILASLIENGFDVNDRDKFQGTPLHYAVQDGHVAAVAYLVRHGADVNAMDRRKLAPLYLAVAQRRDIAVLKQLLKGGARINMQGPVGETALYMAASDSNFSAIKVLLQAGADVEVSTHYHTTPLDVAKVDPRVLVLFQDFGPKDKVPPRSLETEWARFHVHPAYWAFLNSLKDELPWAVKLRGPDIEIPRNLREATDMVTRYAGTGAEECLGKALAATRQTLDHPGDGLIAKINQIRAKHLFKIAGILLKVENKAASDIDAAFRKAALYESKGKHADALVTLYSALRYFREADRIRAQTAHIRGRMKPRQERMQAKKYEAEAKRAKDWDKKIHLLCQALACEETPDRLTLLQEAFSGKCESEKPVDKSEDICIDIDRRYKLIEKKIRYLYVSQVADLEHSHGGRPSMPTAGELCGGFFEIDDEIEEARISWLSLRFRARAQLREARKGGSAEAWKSAEKLHVEAIQAWEYYEPVAPNDEGVAEIKKGFAECRRHAR